MAYPQKPLADYDRSFEMGRDIQPPALPTPDTLKVPRVQGGASPLSDTQRATPAIPGGDGIRAIPAIPAMPTKGEGSYWNRLPLPATPTRHTLYPNTPWERGDVEKQWNPLIKGMGDRLWQTYQALPAEQKALPAWQQVAKNPQEAAYSIVARSLANAANVRSELKPEAASTVQTGNLFRWLNAIGGR
jgi:hypothetical protein